MNLSIQSSMTGSPYPAKSLVRRRPRWASFASTFLALAVWSMAQSAGTALVRHAPSLNGGTIDGSVQMMLGENVSVLGSVTMSGDLLVPGLPTVRLNGNPAFGGTSDGGGNIAPSGYQVTIGGKTSLQHIVRRTDPVALPTMAAPRPPEGTTSIVIASPDPAPPNFSTLRNLTLNDGVGQVAVPPGAYGDFTANAGSGFTLGIAGATTPALYDFAHLRLVPGSQLLVVGPVIVTVANAATVGGVVGNPAHASWLVFNLWSGDLTLTSTASIDGYVNARVGSVSLNGNARITGGVTGNSLALAGNAVVRLQQPAVINNPPTVTLLSPADGTVFTAPAGMTLSAAASDGDGTVTKVEFFAGATKIGEAVGAPFEFVWSNVPPGAYALTAKAWDNAGATATSGIRNVVVQIGVPYFTGFEAPDGYAAGPLGGQLGWAVNGDAALIETGSYAGARALVVGGVGNASQARHDFPPNASQATCFLDLFAKPVAGADAASSILLRAEAAQVAVVRSGDVAEVFVLDGNGLGSGTWTSTGWKAAVGTDGRLASWTRFTVREDFVAKRWDLYVNGRLVAPELGFADNAAQSFNQVVFQGPATSGSVFDDFFVGYDNPLFVDADRDGMEDAWEVQNGLDPHVNDRNADPDRDGVVNIREYLHGTRPNSADTDGDGLPDGWEISHGLSPTTAALPTDDADHDGVTDLQEFAAGTDPQSADTDGDGMPDGWELLFGLNPTDSRDATGDADGDGVSNLLEYQAGTNPNDYYNGALPALLSQIGANLRPGPNGQVSVRVTRADGTPLVNAPVQFSVTSGGIQLSATIGGAPALSVAVRSDAQALASVYVVYPSPVPPLSSLAATAQSGAQIRSLSISLAPPIVDSDGDGLDDNWERQYLGGLSYGANDDPGHVGRTLAQSHFDALSPWPTPVVAAGLQVWYRAELGVSADVTGKVSRWADLSGNAVHLAQPNVATEPQVVATALNGRPAVHFDGNSTSLRSTSVTDLLKGSTDVTVLVVVRAAASQVTYADILDYDHATWPYGGFVLQQDQGALNQYGLGWRNQSNSAWDGLSFTVGVPSGSAQCLTMMKSGGLQSGFLNGQQKMAQSIPAQPLVNAPRYLLLGNFGAGGGRPFNGDIAEVLIYNRALSATERQQVESALLQRYAP